jgi:hypothetical protein
MHACFNDFIQSPVNNIGNIKACMLHSRGGGDEAMSALLSVHNSTVQGAT